ncbi:rhomboid family intramembrane serine protease [Kribbella speibonae]|uniref:Rhomboid family intramembrane serine protease n=1 Tax=Kribbella speibonae TaxID=1572660 RepID=A0A4R0IZB1_9ACTN|nr:rhomboid family intramembrane serine protease [Kribbella speibonae]TCC38829.1 rhomboid family intramembrane serine protease [Kribbella speibonae]
MTAGTVAPNLAPLTTGPRRPVLTAAVFLVTLACGVAQLVHRPLYDHVVRDAARIDDGEWYRLITGMFFQDGWTAGLIVNLVWLAVVGTLAERVFGRLRWLLLYFGCGLFGQFMSYIWLNPVGAGNSMCSAGLLGALTVVVMVASRRYGVTFPTNLRMSAFVVPALAVIGTALHDNHGLPCLLGMTLGYLLLPPRPHRPAQL